MNVITTSFQTLVSGMAMRDGTGKLSSTPDWFQGRATFGGLVAAAGLSVMRGLVSEDRQLRSLLITFVAPVAPGEAEVKAACLRAGRSASVIETHIVQEGAVCAVLVGSFGADRQSAIAIEAPARPVTAGPDAFPPLPYVEGMTPTFTQHFDYRYALGGFPFSGSTESFMGGWCRFRAGNEPVRQEHILGLVDAWPPTVLPLLAVPVNASTLVWSIQFLNWNPTARADQWWFYRADTEAARNGYAQTRSVLWDPEGRPAAISTQTVAIFG